MGGNERFIYIQIGCVENDTHMDMQRLFPPDIMICNISPDKRIKSMSANRNTRSLKDKCFSGVPNHKKTQDLFTVSVFIKI